MIRIAKKTMKHAIFLLLVLSASAFAADQKAGMDDWLTFYYQHPQPERFVAEVHALSKSAVFSKESARPPMLAFLGRVMAQNPDKITGWMTALGDLPAKDLEVLYAAVWFSETEEGNRYLESNGIKGFAGKTPPEILKMEIDSPAVIDMLWGWFYATGQEEAVRRVVSALNLSQYEGAFDKFKTSPKTEQNKREAFNDMAFRSAGWSLTTNCELHPKVLEICEKLYQGDTLGKTERSWLGTVLTKAGQTGGKQEPDHWMLNGKPVPESPNMKSKAGFGAQLFLTESTRFFADWKNADAPQIEPLTKVRRNARFYTVLLFADPGVDADGAADVTCDIVIHSPDGIVYSKTGGLRCWKGKYSAQSRNLQLSQGSMSILIKPEDMTGVYEVQVTVRDNVKKVELPLKTSFEVE